MGSSPVAGATYVIEILQHCDKKFKTKTKSQSFKA